MDRESWRAPHDQPRHGQAPFQQPLVEGQRARQARLGGLPALGQVVVVDLAVVGVQAVGDQVRQPVDQRIKLGGRVARRDSGPAHPDLQVDQDRNRAARAPAAAADSARAESG